MESGTVVCRQNEERVKPELVIVGGGLAGAAAAITLSEAGRQVLLLERERAPQHKVCGEFLSQEALESLRALGVDPGELGATTITSVRLADSRRVTRVALPFAAMSMTRRRLDEALLLRAEQAGATVARGTRVLQVQREGATWSVAVESGAAMQPIPPQAIESRTICAPTICTPTIFVATGKHDLPGRPRPSGSQHGMVGFKMYFRLRAEQAAQLAGHVELLLFRGGHAGLQLVEDGTANLGCIVQQGRLRQLGGGWEPLLAAMQAECPHLRRRLAGAEPMLERALAIAPIPYGYVRPSAAAEGLWSLGDQAAVIPSFTGDGMSIALHSGRLAAKMYLAGATAEAYQQRVQGELARQVRLAVTVSRGLVWRPTRAAMTAAVRWRPELLAMVGRRTRIAAGARL